MSFDLADSVFDDFPILHRRVRGNQKLVYLDSAATSQKPTEVIEAVSNYYETTNATIHRSGHELGELASAAYESARANVASFVGVESGNLVFTKNATESINLIAYAILNATLLNSKDTNLYRKYALKADDEIWLTEMEHHANLVPWQHLSKVTGAKLKYIAVSEDGELQFDANQITRKAKIIAVTHQSNVLGTINNIAEISKVANLNNALLILDACQSVPHLPTNFAELGVAAAAWSGHKMLGPTGIGLLYLRNDLLTELPPFLFGGNMIENVTFEQSTFRSDNGRFEAGTMNIAQAIGLSAAVDYLKNVGMTKIHGHESALIKYALSELLQMPGIRVLGPRSSDNRGGIVSFEVNGVHPHDVSQFLDAKGIAVRAGHHCAWPLHRKLGAVASTRASFYLYNTKQDVTDFLDALSQVRKYFKVV